MTIGLHIMRPTSIAVAGGGTETASIRSDGGVDFANATSLSLNGVFTSDYDDYMIVIRHNGSTPNQLDGRLRTSGSDATAADYVCQYLRAGSTTVQGARLTGQTLFRWGNSDTQEAGHTVNIYGPALAQPTATRTISVRSSSYEINDWACTHSLSTAYDGVTLLTNTGSFTGLVTVYGLAQ